MRIIVASVPGAGKTTVMNIVKEKLPSVKIVNVGGMILEIAEKKLKIKDRDELRKRLTIEQQREFQEETSRKIAKMKDKIIILDTHVAIKTPHGYFPGLSESTVHLIKPDAIVLLEFRGEDVLERRKKDSSRHRDMETAKDIEEHQRYNREFAFAAASHVDASVEIIDLTYKQKKKFEHAEKAANEIVKLIES